MRDLKNQYGPWALVTGASSGIGEEFAYQLASMGFNLVLVSRSIDKLDRVVNQVKLKYGIEILVIPMDLSHDDFLKELSDKTKSLDIGLLVSNAAAFNYGSFHKSDLNELTEFLKLNTSAHLQLVHFYGNKMKAKGTGGIIVVSSAGGFSSIPYMASYVASKAYIISLGEALHLELKEHGVDVMVLAPGPTNTPGTMNAKNVDNKKLGISFMSPKIVVEQALKNIGKRAVLIPGGINKFSYFVSKRILSRSMMSKFLGGIIKRAISPDVI